MSSWDRREDESESDWLAFKSYRDQSPPRNLKRTAAALVDHSLADVVALCNKFAWRERAKEYDAHLDLVLQKEREEFLKQDARKRAADHMMLLKDAREALACELRKLLEWTSQTNVGVMQPQQVTKMLDIVVKLERLVGGESTENAQTSFDLSGLSVDELRVLDKILTKANVSLPGMSRGAKSVS